MTEDNSFPSEQTQMMNSTEIDALQERLRQEQAENHLDTTVNMTLNEQEEQYAGKQIVRRYGPNINLIWYNRPNTILYFGSFFAEPGSATQEFTTGIVFSSEEELKKHLDEIFAKSDKKAVEINDYIGKPNLLSYAVPETSASTLRMPWDTIAHHNVIDLEVKLADGRTISGSCDTKNIIAVPFVEYTTGPLFRSEQDFLEHVQNTFGKTAEIRRNIPRHREFSTWGKDAYLYGRIRSGKMEPGTSVEALVVNLKREVLYQ